LGPHPHPKRKILFLPRAPIKAPISKTPVPAASCGIPAQKPVDGAQTAVDVVRVVKQAGPAAAKGSPTAARIAASRARRIARDAAMDWLASTYPLAFGADVKPVAIGVGKLIWPDAKAEGIKRRGFNDALSRRASSRAYLKALAADGAMRVGLDGDAVEAVSIEHQVLALDRIAKIERRLDGEGARR
jgi:hypothetical protein